MSKNLFSLIVSDIKAAMDRDPAARSYLEIILTYPGFHAVLGYRISHLLWNLKLKLIARFVSNIFRILTAIEIHPAVKIGNGFFVDHGAGLVIGETAVLGNNITMYQQVTLGGISPSLRAKEQKNTPRHPIIEDEVIIGSGAQILGSITIGKNSRIGANAVVLKNVPANQTYIGIPARKVRSSIENNSFDPYGITDGKIDDPNKKSIVGLLSELHELNSKIVHIEHEIKEFKLKERNLKSILNSKKIEIRSLKEK